MSQGSGRQSDRPLPVLAPEQLVYVVASRWGTTIHRASEMRRGQLQGADIEVDRDYPSCLREAHATFIGTWQDFQSEFGDGDRRYCVKCW